MGRTGKVLGSLAVGAAVTILVSWACAAWSKSTGQSEWLPGESVPARVRLELPASWIAPRPNPLAASHGVPPEMSTFRIWYKEDRGLGASLVHCMVDENFASLRINRGEHDHELCRLRAGWPVAAMEMSITQGALALAPAFSDAVLAPDWVQRPDRSTRVGAKPRSLMWERYLPLRPVALGLALDTLLYSAVAFAAFSTAGGVR